jgi:histidyl-tRNA synthetase
MAQFFGPKGTRDMFPEDMAMREHLFTSWERTCKRFGFEKYDGPMFEHLDVFTQKSGDEIEKQLYAFEDKGGRKIALRPEMTPTLARMVAARAGALKRPVRWYSMPTLFRYERSQKGRLREFIQLNMDILGIADVTADAELIAAAIHVLLDLGLTSSDFKVHISSRVLLEELLCGVGVAKEMLPSIYALLDKKAKIPPEVFTTELSSIVSDVVLCNNITTVLTAQTLDEATSLVPDAPAVITMKRLLAMLDAYGIGDCIMFDIGIVRGLAYYTGIVFEVYDTNQEMRAIAGGGRYDKLVSQYGGPDTPAIGFAVGDVVLTDLLSEKKLLPTVPGRSRVFVATFERDEPFKAIAMTKLIRDAGISAENTLKLQAIGKQLNQAAAAGVKWTVIVGGDEEKEGLYMLREMQSGTEKKIPFALICDQVQRDSF